MSHRHATFQTGSKNYKNLLMVLVSVGPQVGPPYLMHREDMERVAPLWYNFTHAVRNDPQVNSPLFASSPINTLAALHGLW